ncbi:putative yippee family protein [Golovinomyces cichoracearum]|uniref:Putative yippee family protein n=1 Tax=Golovinomyces cichoracearum TaxID=62708 RepID=A0A420IJ65_9PEZI|nr:putative yippee family protein [Golovinomyces cichoracearum]
MVDTIPPFVSFLLPATLRPFQNRHSSSSISNTKNNSRRSISPASTTNTELKPSSTNLTLPSSTCDRISSCRKLKNPLKIISRSYLSRQYPSTLRCLKCSTDLAYTSQILSKVFVGRLGRAYLVSPPPPPPFVPSFPPKPRPKADLVNTRSERPISRELMTGWHVVTDVSCIVCGTVLGWKYLDAREESQRYKVGKVMLERERICVRGVWEDETKDDLNAEILNEWADRVSEISVQFDSDDEEERENLFSGVWNKDVVARRRKNKKPIRREIDTTSFNTLETSN